MLSITCFTRIALHDAYGIAHRLHCDITPGNIILYHDGPPPTGPPPTEEHRNGYLVDWELSCDTSTKSEKTHRRDASVSTSRLVLPMQRITCSDSRHRCIGSSLLSAYSKTRTHRTRYRTTWSPYTMSSCIVHSFTSHITSTGTNSFVCLV